MGCMFGGFILGIFLLLGFTYVVWILAGKESGAVKLIGQIIAVVVALLALALILHGGIYGGKMKMKMMHGGMMCPMDKMEMPAKTMPAAPAKK